MPAVGTKGYEEFTLTGAKDVERERNLNCVTANLHTPLSALFRV